MFCKKGVLRNFAKFTRKHLRQSIFFNKVADLRPATLLKKRLWHRCFPADFAKFLRTSFLTEHRRWLLLFFIYSSSCFYLKGSINLSITKIVLAKKDYLRPLKYFVTCVETLEMGHVTLLLFIISSFHHFILIKWKWENLGRKLNIMSNYSFEQSFLNKFHKKIDEII